jgi:hypothetical protein
MAARSAAIRERFPRIMALRAFHAGYETKNSE